MKKYRTMTQEFAEAQAEVLRIYRDALIEKTCEWLKKEYPRVAAYYEHPDSFIDQFRKAMKGD